MSRVQLTGGAGGCGPGQVGVAVVAPGAVGCGQAGAPAGSAGIRSHMIGYASTAIPPVSRPVTAKMTRNSVGSRSN